MVWDVKDVENVVIFVYICFKVFKFKQVETTIYNGGFVVKQLMRNMLM